MDSGSILKTLGFIIIFGAFFAYSLTNDLFNKMTLLINDFNNDFFSKIPTDILFLFSFFVFILVFSFIIRLKD